MTYEETLNYMFAQLPMFQRIGAAAYKADLSNTIDICKAIGNPELEFNSIHIAGTNGKGSTSNMLSSILQERGLKVGLYTSPHLRDFRERIRVNGEMISEEAVIEFVEDYKSVFEDIKPSFFEMTYAMAVKYFADQKVDIAVMECGMGGRLDSTNTIKSIVSVITNIGFDHVQFLGDTLSKIAAEKAGIIKREIPVIIGETHSDTENVFINKANELNSNIVFADQTYSLTIKSKSPLMIDILEGDNVIYRNVNMPLEGVYQLKNILTVSAVVNELNKQELNITTEIFQQGIANTIKNTNFAGRWQKLNNNPLTICDTGHNEDGIRMILEQLNSMKYDNLHFVIGMVNDKDINKVISMLPTNATYYFCKADIPRGMPAEELQQVALKYGLLGNVYSSVNNAYKTAIKAAKDNDLVFIGGSTFTVAEVV